ncbi:MAG: glycosyltransferase family 4 protein, partial [Caldilineaceae bacterium]|nr:glycosyltransferase family 4 protein [Caldilineaceae bacterium]
AAYEDKSFGRVVKWDGIRLDFPHEFLSGAEGKAIGPFIDSVDLADHLSVFSPDVVVVYGYSQKLQRRALKWAKTENVPVLMISDSELHAARRGVKSAIKSMVLPRVYSNVSLFLTVGDANEAYYRNYGVRDDRLIRCFFPIDVSHYDSIVAERDECRNHVRNLLGIPANHKVLLMVGKLVPWKRQVDLVHFSNAILRKRSDVTVVLAGSGPDEAALRALTQRTGAGGVVFAGFVSPEVLAEYYCAADIYVHCSAHEPHSLAISEAIYCGLPVVLSDKCGSYGPTDDVRPGLNGFTYRCGDVGNLSRVLLYVLGGDVQVRMGKASLRISRYQQKLAHGEALTQALTVSDLVRIDRQGCLEKNSRAFDADVDVS